MQLEELLTLLKANDCFVLAGKDFDDRTELTAKGIDIVVRLGNDLSRNCLAEGKAVGTELTGTIVQAVEDMVDSASRRIAQLQDRMEQAQEVLTRCGRIRDLVRG